jgi:hypothetical protein
MLSNLLDNIKKIVLYVLTPLAFISGYIAYLLTKNHELTEKKEDLKFEVKDAENEKKQEVIDKTISESMDDYELAKRQFRESEAKSDTKS